MDLRFHTEAASELQAAGDWYEAGREGLAADFLDEVNRAADVIIESPQLSPLWPSTPPARIIRRFLMPRFPFALAYQVFENEIVVLAVAHERRRPGYWLGRSA